MQIIALSALAGLALAGAPAFGQTVMLNYSAPEMKQQLLDIKSTIRKESVLTDGTRYIEATAESGLIYTVYGLECDTAEATQRCRGAEMSTSFKLEGDNRVEEAMELIDYAAVADFKSDDNRLKLSRYVIFDDGITPGNLKVNLQVFINISNDVWDMLEEEGFFKK